MKKIILIFIMILIGWVQPCFAMERFEIITTEELERMLEDRAAGKLEFALVNTLDEIVFLDSSIPGSVNVPWSRVEKSIGQVGDNKDLLLIMY